MSGIFIALDTNILVYAHHRGSPWHAKARQALESVANAAQPWAIPWPCVHEFVAVVTHPKLFSRPDSVEQALDAVEAWMESPSLRLLGELRGHWGEFRQVVRAGQIRGGAVHDARIAALCREHGISELWTADRDFSRMSGVRTRNPLVDR